MPKGIKKEDPDYLEKRKKNNEAIRKTRLKQKQKQQETQEQVNNLKEENQRVESKIREMEGQLNVLKDIFKSHTAAPKVLAQPAPADVLRAPAAPQGFIQPADVLPSSSGFAAAANGASGANPSLDELDQLLFDS